MSANVYAVTYDLRIGRTWLAGDNPNGWSSRNVLANGDARSACRVLERDELATAYDGKRPNKVRILKVEMVAADVLSETRGAR